MLQIPTSVERHCDGVHRRTFLQMGTLGIGGLALPDILRAEALSGTRTRKSVIMVYLSGGPSQIDTFDMKPDAPGEIRGEFDPISTNVPGVQICELMPRTAQIMDKLSVVRSVTGMPAEHAAFHLHTGKRNNIGGPPGGWPSMGSVISKLHGRVHESMPPFCSLMRPMVHKPYGDPGPHGFLGSAHAPFRPNGEMMADMTLNNISTGRLSDRKALWRSLDVMRRKVDAGLRDGTDTFVQLALETLTSSRLLEALDVSKEDGATRDMYGNLGQKMASELNDTRMAPGTTRDLLVARRLVEAGARCVTLTLGKWDMHTKNFVGCRNLIPVFDRAIWALVQDLHRRGLDKDVSVVFWGEFGRTPKINKNAGRDHWMTSMSVLFAGGGMKMGQVIGATDKHAGEVTERPIHYTQVLSTLYHNMGIDPHHATVTDLNGRPHYLSEHREPIRELT